jgi:hypothetical protein
MMMRYITILILTILITGCGSTGASGTSSDGAMATNSGKGGSMARFALSGDYLYTLNKREMEVFYIGEPSTPQPQSRVHVPFDVETLFNFKDYLYIGGESGVYIYDTSTPTQPTKVAQYTHTRSCDPVVVSQNNLAFVTLNKGSTCRLNSGENTLQVLDVEDPTQPKLLKTMGMWDPKGLGIDDDNKTLFVCDGSAGLKVFDVTKYDHNETNQTRVEILAKPQKSIADINCYDVIPNHGNLIVSNGENVRQFDYTHFPMKELGKIK